MKLTKALNIVWGMAHNGADEYIENWEEDRGTIQEALNLMHLHCVTLPDHEEEYGYAKTRAIEAFESVEYVEDSEDDQRRNDIVRQDNMKNNKIQDVRPGDFVTALVSGPIAVGGETYEVFEIRLRDGYTGLTLLKPNHLLSKRSWSSFDVSGNNLSELFRVN